MLMLAVWSVCTAHCTVEYLSGAAFVQCCTDEGSAADDHGAAQCVCSSIQASGGVFQKDVQSVPVPAAVLCLFDALSQDDARLSTEGVVKTTLCPLKTLPPWQFSARTALPPRAPSLIS